MSCNEQTHGGYIRGYVHHVAKSHVLQQEMPQELARRSRRAVAKSSGQGRAHYNCMATRFAKRGDVHVVPSDVTLSDGVRMAVPSSRVIQHQYPRALARRTIRVRHAWAHGTCRSSR